MKSILNKQLMFLVLLAFGFISCHNGEEPTPDQEKVLDHLIFEEICYSGTWKVNEENGGEYLYNDDKYIKITNPTKTTLYLDGMGLAQSGLSASNIVTLREGTDYRKTHFGAGVLLRFPGKVGEKNYPVPAGKSVFLAQVAVNHTKELGEDSDFWKWNKDSYDLSKVNFEWATVKQIEEDDDFPENPDVPNMISVYPVERTEMRIIPEYGVLALIKIPADVTDEKLLSDEKYRWSTTWVTDQKDSEDGGGHTHNASGDAVVFVKIPNEWVVDAVQICPQQELRWNVVADNVEKGSCSIYTSAQDKTTNPKKYVGLSLYRKYDGIKFVDTNNSDLDFEVKPASLAKKK